MQTPRGFVFFDGTSSIDGAPIIGIVVLRSENVKTGDMAQSYILRADIPPMHAISTGDDASICGDCMHRGDKAAGRARTCYVDVSKSVQSVYWAWVRGSYPRVDLSKAADRALVRRWLSGRALRIGSYGDPAAIIPDAWLILAGFANGHTGYSHQWRQAFAQPLRGLVMASADTAAERDLARAMGWRTFRVRSAAESLGTREIECPASPAGGDRRQCVTCKACDGASRGPSQASVSIIVHGRMARHFQPVNA